MMDTLLSEFISVTIRKQAQALCLQRVILTNFNVCLSCTNICQRLRMYLYHKTKVLSFAFHGRIHNIATVTEAGESRH